MNGSFVSGGTTSFVGFWPESAPHCVFRYEEAIPGAGHFENRRTLCDATALILVVLRRPGLRGVQIESEGSKVCGCPGAADFYRMSKTGVVHCRPEGRSSGCGPQQGAQC